MVHIISVSNDGINKRLILKYKINGLMREMELRIELMYQFLCVKFYTEGVRTSEVENILSSGIEAEDYRYIIAYIKDFHDVGTKK